MIHASNPSIGLSLSGGGVRAAAFHLGLLKRLAHEDLLESVSVVSTVSGGSLVTAAMISRAGVKWPSSERFVRDIYPAMSQLLTGVDLFSIRALNWSVLKRRHFGLLRERATTLADLLESNWGVTGLIGQLPDTPRWIVNATCIETGKNWRFQKREMGDWSFGKHYAPDVPIATAAAASAAVPYFIGAMPLDLPSNGWWRTDPATNKPVAATQPRLARVHLWDGGAYENLGLESIYKPGRELIDCDFLICSDASGPLKPASGWPIRSLLRGKLAAPRLFDVSSDQIRSLRSRMLVADLASKRIRGALVRMGNSVRSLDVKAATARVAGFYDTCTAGRGRVGRTRSPHRSRRVDA
ncbi:patatin-like phospholipase family protein [Bradyrhizobium sp. RDT46]|uniref:patatin-like phospholipase family protein n=1 Tax=Bradyrhizobium sp. RDT46 TaxID=3341829 RepID=UPI0035C75905